MSNPVAVYNAANNIEAHLICELLVNHGIEAYATRDESVVGIAVFGPLPEIHKPQVWVDLTNVEAVAPVLAEYELERRRRNEQHFTEQDADSTIAVVCEDCGESTMFHVSKRGTVQDCSHCGAYVDVEDGVSLGTDEDYGEAE